MMIRFAVVLGLLRDGRREASTWARRQSRDKSLILQELSAKSSIRGKQQACAARVATTTKIKDVFIPEARGFPFANFFSGPAERPSRGYSQPFFQLVGPAMAAVSLGELRCLNCGWPAPPPPVVSVRGLLRPCAYCGKTFVGASD
jgi:hypothetical protein